MAVLVIAEHDQSSLKHATRATIAAAHRLGGNVTVLVAGVQCQPVVDVVGGINGVAKVLYADDERYRHVLAEELAPLVVSIGRDYTHILAPATTFGKNLLPRVAALLDVAQLSDVIEIIAPDTFVRPIYAGNALATVRSRDSVKVITLRPTAFVPAADGGSAAIEKISPANTQSNALFVSRDTTASTRPDLTQARVVISGGRGVGSRDNFRLLEALADQLGGAIGASRAAVDAGFAPNDWQVGQTGKVVAPDLYIAVGISGAIQHLAGITEAKVIVAINKDEQAAIFNSADYGLVADLRQALPELTAVLGKVAR